MASGSGPYPHSRTSTDEPMTTDPQPPAIRRVPDPSGGLCDSLDGCIPNSGLLCTVLCHADGSDTTLGGITSTTHHVVLTDPLEVRKRRGLPCEEPLGFMSPSLDPDGPRYAPELQLRLRAGRVIACPPDALPDGSPYAFGGNFVFTSDTRFPDHRPIPVHDRDTRRERGARWADPSAPKGPPRGLRLEVRELRESAIGARHAGEDLLAQGYPVRIYPVEGGEDEFRWYAEAFGYSGRCQP